MNMAKEFDQYTAHLSEGLGHVDRQAGLSWISPRLRL